MQYVLLRLHERSSLLSLPRLPQGPPCYSGTISSLSPPVIVDCCQIFWCPYLGSVLSMITFQSSLFSFFGTTWFLCFHFLLGNLAFQLLKPFSFLLLICFVFSYKISKLLMLSEKNGGQRKIKALIFYVFMAMKLNSIV